MPVSRMPIAMLLLAGLGSTVATPAVAQRHPVAPLIQTRDRDLSAIRAQATTAIANLPRSSLTIALINQRLGPIHSALVAWGAKYSVPIHRRVVPAIPLTTANAPNAATVIVKLHRSPNGPIVACPPLSVAGVHCFITGATGSDTEISCTYDCPDPPEK
jgi:hypothetical protein